MSNLHENKNYKIVLQDTDLGKPEYAVINKATNVVESTSQSLPYAIAEAEQSNSYLAHEMWKWIDVQSKRSREEMDKANIEGLFDSTVLQ